MRPSFARHAGIVILLVGIAPLTRADATFRYHTDIQTTPAIPVATVQQALAGIQDLVVRVKGNKVTSATGKFTSIVDLTTHDMFLVDPVNKRFASASADQYAQQAKSALPALPPEASAILSSMKSNFESHSTGRAEVVQGIQAEEQEFVLSVDMALPGGPVIPGPFMKLVMQVWTAKPEELQRVPALLEFKNYTSTANVFVNSADMIKQILNIMPGMGDGFGAMVTEMGKKNSVSLRMHMEVVMPVLATIMQQMPQQGRQALPAGLDPNAPLMQLNQELVELSSDSLDNALFEVPADYQMASLVDLLKSAAPAPPPTFKQ